MATLNVWLLSLIVLLAAATGEIGGQMSSCRQYLRDSSRFENSGWREEFPLCCQELEQISQECRCEAVKQVVQESQQGGELQEREMREMLQTAESLPSLCRIPPHYCQNIRGVGGGSVF